MQAWRDGDGVVALAGQPISTPSRDIALEQNLRRGGGIANGNVPLRYTPSYTRFVNLMKMVLPLVALVLISLVLVWPHLKPATNKFKIGIAALKTQFTKDANMTNPRYVGTDRNQRPFSVTADIAKNLSKNSGAVEMEMPKADITLKDGSWLVLTAKEGIFNKDAKKLELQGAVNMFHDSGYEFRTAKLHVDLETGTATSSVPVQGQGPFGTLKSEGFRLVDRAQTIFFTGKTQMIIYPGIKGSKK